MKLRSTIAAAAIATSVALSGTIAGLVPAAIAQEAAQDQQATSSKDQVLAAIAARTAAIKAQDDHTAAIAAADASRGKPAEEVAKTISYGTAGETFNTGVDELNAVVKDLGLPKIGEPGGPIAADKFAGTPKVELGYRPFANKADYDAFNAKLSEAYGRGPSDRMQQVVDGLAKINGNRDALKNAVKPYYDALEKGDAPSSEAAAKVEQTRQAAGAAIIAAEKIDTKATLDTFQAQSLDSIAAATKNLDTRLAEKKAAKHNVEAAEKAVAAAHDALGAAKAILEAIKGGTPYENRDAVLNAVEALGAAEAATAEANAELDKTVAPAEPKPEDKGDADKGDGDKGDGDKGDAGKGDADKGDADKAETPKPRAGLFGFLTKIWNWLNGFFFKLSS